MIDPPTTEQIGELLGAEYRDFIVRINFDLVTCPYEKCPGFVDASLDKGLKRQCFTCKKPICSSCLGKQHGSFWGCKNTRR